MSIKLDQYQEPDQSLWQGPEDGLRFHQTVRCQSIQISNDKPGISLLGFCSDEGVTRNHGRKGASNGPKVLRQNLGRLTLPKEIPLVDVGDIVSTQDLESAQKNVGKAVEWLHNQNQTTVVLGGGHETAWGHFQGLKNQAFVDDIAIINFDAHFDLRQANKSTSGTPFYQICELCEFQNIPFHYYCFGIQPQANTQTLFDTADKTNTQYWTAQSIHQNPAIMQDSLDKILSKHKAVYVSVCLDAISMAYAPGVSAPSVLGLMPWQVDSAIAQCATSGKVRAFDCVELAPVLDLNGMTARLGAQLVGTFLANQG